MKANVVSFAQGRQHLARRKESANHAKVAQFFEDIWRQIIERITVEFPNTGVISMQCDFLQAPHDWWTSCWSSRARKMSYRDAKGKKRYIRDVDMYANLARLRQIASKRYRVLAKGTRSSTTKHAIAQGK